MSSLAADPNDGSKLLLGNDLDKRIQDINAQSKIKSSLATNGHGKSSYRSSGARENSHHLDKCEHYTKNSTASPATKKAPLGGSKHTKGGGLHQKEKHLIKGQ